MALTLVTAPTALPVTLAELKENLRIDGESEDAHLLNLLRAATDRAETITGRALITQTWDYRIGSFPAKIELPKPPLQSITSITYTNADGDATVLASTVYEADIYANVGYVREASGQTWPTVGDYLNPVTIRYVAGYGATWNDVPHQLRLGIMGMVAHWYENREPVLVGMTRTPMPMHMDAIFSSFMIGGRF